MPSDDSDIINASNTLIRTTNIQPTAKRFSGPVCDFKCRIEDDVHPSAHAHTAATGNSGATIATRERGRASAMPLTCTECDYLNHIVLDERTAINSTEINTYIRSQTNNRAIDSQTSKFKYTNSVNRIHENPNSVE